MFVFQSEKFPNKRTMKKLSLILLQLFSFTGLLLAQAEVQKTNSVITQVDIVGRWQEIERTVDPNSSSAQDPLAIYIFKKDGTFHKGREAEGLILFDVAGKYKIEADTIHVLYFDFSRSQSAGSAKAKRMSMKVLSCSDDELNVAVRQSRLNKYTSILRRQEVE